MSVSIAADMLAPTRPGDAPGKVASFALTVGMHVLLAALLIYGVSWQRQVPPAVQVELVRAVPPASTSRPEPELTPPPMIEPVPEPPPSPAPRIEVKPPAKPDIAVKEKAKPEPKPKPKPEPKPAPIAEPRPDKHREALQREAAQLERNKLMSELDKELAQAKAGKAEAANAKAMDRWQTLMVNKVRGNIVLPPEVRGNPEATFKVIQLPSGEIMGVSLSRSSGNRALDAAIERAILKSSPLPKPEKPELFQRELELVFRPLEN